MGVGVLYTRGGNQVVMVVGVVQVTRWIVVWWDSR